MRISRTWIVLLVLGIVAVVLGGVLSAIALVGGLDEPILQTPGTVSEHAHSGEYLLYAESGTHTGFPGFSYDHTADPQLNAGAFTLTEDGSTLSITAYTGNVQQTEDRGNRIFLAVAQVHVPHSGRLTLTVSDDEGAVVLGPSLGGVFLRALPGILVGFLGLVLIVVAVIVRLQAVRRRRPPPGWGPPPPGYGPPPGWGAQLPGYGTPMPGYPPAWGPPPPGYGAPPPPGEGAPWGWKPAGS